MSRGPIWDVVSPHLEGLKPTGSNNAKARCPFHHDATPSFAINLLNGLWICHAGCGAGTLKTLLSLLGQSNDQIRETLDPIQADIQANVQRKKLRDEVKFLDNPYLGEHILGEDLLGVYDYCPLYMTERGFDPKILRAYDIGYDQKLKRVTFPIRDFYGNLVGVSGRSDDGHSLRYKYYLGRHHVSGRTVEGDFGDNFNDEYPGYSLDKRKYLWNGHIALRILLESDTDQPLIVVEGFKACLWLIQCGFPTTVALMGARMSEIQFDLISKVANPIILFLDNNNAGISGTRLMGEKLIKVNLETRAVQYPDWADNTTQPDDFSAKGAKLVIENAKRWTWLRMKGF